MILLYNLLPTKVSGISQIAPVYSLVLASLLMYWSDGRWLGLDFLGFIALSSLVMEFIRNEKSPLTYSIAGLVLISLLRYLLGLLIQSFGNEPQTWGILNWILGTKDAPGVSYPLSPWMAYPFVGYIIGVAVMFVLAASLTLFYSQESKDLALFPRTFGQIVLCLLFVVCLPL